MTFTLDFRYDERSEVQTSVGSSDAGVTLLCVCVCVCIYVCV